MRLALACLPIMLATPAIAQFPPPGVYLCTVETGEEIGELNLFVAGDYSFRNVDGNSAGGQLASAGSDINALSGPLEEMGWTGNFGTDAGGSTTLSFATHDGIEVSCK